MQHFAMSTRSEDADRSVLEPLRPHETELAFRDGLTGLYNYRLLDEILDKRWSELVALSDRFAIVILDLDLFKDVNDRYGHLSGDEVLRETGKILNRAFRAGDFVFRYGGDEFVVLLPGADAEEASSLGERARGAMLEAEFVAAEEERKIEIPVSFSIGVAAYPGDGESGKAVLARADERLYHEKQLLKNKVKRRRLAVSAGALGVLAAIAIGVVLFFSDRTPEPVGPPPAASAPSPAIVPAQSEEENLLLARIAELQQEIDRLSKAKAEQKAPDAKKSGDEIAALQSRVRELTERLETRAPAVPAPGVEASRPSVERAAVDAPDVEPELRTSPAMPATSPPRTETVKITPPKLLEPVTPKYPSMALERRVEATIEFTVLVDESGRVVAAYPSGSAKGLGFDEAARAAAFASRWKPGTRGGSPTPMETKLLVHFKIRQ
jgi:TonB family protein